MQFNARSRMLAVAIAAAFVTTPAAMAQITTAGDVSPAVGPGSDTFDGILFVGNVADGSVSVINGTTLTGGSVYLGQGAGFTGTMTVQGAGSSVTATDRFRVGGNGTGVLNILSGALVSSLGGSLGSPFTAHIAQFEGSSGTVNVDGGTFFVDRSDGLSLLNVGTAGTGVLNVTNGGRVQIGTAASGTGIENGSTLNVGGANIASGPVPASHGTALVSGSGSVIELLGSNAGVNVGRMGAETTGLLTVENGGLVRAGTLLAIGRGREGEIGLGAAGTVIVDGTGSRIEITEVRTCCTDTGNGGNIVVGRDDASGTLTVRNGGVVKLDAQGATVDAGGVTVGRDALSSGIINLQSGGRLELISDSTNDSFGMTVGRLGSGTLNITDGGELSITNTGTGGLGLTFGGNASAAMGGSFSALISGTGSTLNLTGIDGTLTVGRNAGGSGTVTFQAGATANLANRITVGAESGSSGILNITGAGTVVNLKSNAADGRGAGITVARSGVGTVEISDGAVVNVDGTGGAQRHTTNVGGAGTGSGGTGRLTVTGAGTRYNVTGASTALVLGRDDGNGGAPSEGRMTIADGAQVNFPDSGRGAVGYSPGSTGVLVVSGTGSRLNMGAFLGVGRDLDDNEGGEGTLNVGSGGVVKADTVSIGTSGALTGNGTIEGTVTNHGLILPGSSPGTLTITGGLTLTDTSLLIIELGGTGPGEFDRIAVGGELTADGTLRVISAGGYIPAPGDTFDVLTFASRSGSFDSIVFLGFGTAGANLVGSFHGGSFRVTAVPEPHEWALMLAGLVLVRVFARRQR